MEGLDLVSQQELKQSLAFGPYSNIENTLKSSPLVVQPTATNSQVLGLYLQQRNKLKYEAKWSSWLRPLLGQIGLHFKQFYWANSKPSNAHEAAPKLGLSWAE